MYTADVLAPLFDEAHYLETHADVAAAFAKGHERSGWGHYSRIGFLKGRKIKGFDPGYYLRSYPLAAEEIARGRATDPVNHYILFGHARGYLTHPDGPRPANGAALKSPFGGFWIDQPNARDLIQGRLDVGLINQVQAERLLFWLENGYVILSSALRAELIERALEEFDRAYAGKLPGLLFECQAVVGARGAVPWRPEFNDHPAKALDIHFFSPAIRDLIFSDPIAEFLGLIFESRAFASQTLGFYRGSAQEGHQDSAYVAYTIPRQFAASWIALEDVTLGAGELFYYPGSHQLDEFLYAEKYKSFHEAMRNTKTEFPHGEVGRHVRSLADAATRFEFEKKTFAAKKGDILIWHADLVHGGAPISDARTRKSVVTHYCPKHISPLYAEQRAIALHRHGDHVYASSQYLTAAPAV